MDGIEECTSFIERVTLGFEDCVGCKMYKWEFCMVVFTREDGGGREGGAGKEFTYRTDHRGEPVRKV